MSPFGKKITTIKNETLVHFGHIFSNFEKIKYIHKSSYKRINTVNNDLFCLFSRNMSGHTADVLISCWNAKMFQFTPDPRGEQLAPISSFPGSN
jgi:hypothetical protein